MHFSLLLAINVIIGLLFGWYLGQQILKAKIQYKGPNSSKIRQETHKMGDICYRLVPHAVVGPLCERATYIPHDTPKKFD